MSNTNRYFLLRCGIKYVQFIHRAISLMFCLTLFHTPTLIRAKLEKMPSIPEEPEVPESEVERFTMPDFVKPLYDLDVVEGKEAVLKCKVAGLPYPTISWFHNGKKIESTEDRKMTQCELLQYFSVLHGGQSVRQTLTLQSQSK